MLRNYIIAFSGGYKKKDSKTTAKVGQLTDFLFLAATESLFQHWSGGRFAWICESLVPALSDRDFEGYTSL